MLPWHGRGRGFKSHPVHHILGLKTTEEVYSSFLEDADVRII